MMKKIALSAVMAFAALAQAAEYEIDPGHTNVRFAIDHFATSTNVGGFYGLEGTVTFDEEAQTGSVDVAIPVKNINSGNKDFDGHLQSPDLFDAEKHPEMRFVSTKWHFADGKVTQVDGDLTLLGQTHPVTLTASKFNCYDNPRMKKEVCGGDFHTTLDRTQWGMNYLVDVGMTKDVDIAIQIEAAKK